jgi:hypothetical protein
MLEQPAGNKKKYAQTPINTRWRRIHLARYCAAAADDDDDEEEGMVRPHIYQLNGWLGLKCIADESQHRVFRASTHRPTLNNPPSFRKSPKGKKRANRRKIEAQVQTQKHRLVWLPWWVVLDGWKWWHGRVRCFSPAFTEFVGMVVIFTIGHLRYTYSMNAVSKPFGHTLAICSGFEKTASMITRACAMRERSRLVTATCWIEKAGGKTPRPDHA